MKFIKFVQTLKDDALANDMFDDDSSDEDEDEESVLLMESNEEPTVPKLRNVVKKIRKSPQMRQKLKKICDLLETKYLTPVIDVSTRWDSTFEMIERAIYLKAAMNVLCSKEKSLKKLQLSDEEWSKLNAIGTLLKKFRRSTKYMSMERHPTICAYLPTFDWIVQAVESFISDNPGPLGNAAKAGLAKLKKYEEQFQLSNCTSIYIAVFLNPALKLNYFKEHGYSKAKIRDIQKMIYEVLEKNYGGETVENCEDEEKDEADEFLSHMFKRSKSSREPKEFQKYLNHPLSNEQFEAKKIASILR